MGFKAAVQILKRAEDLKPKVLKKCDLLVDSQSWTDQQQLQSLYHQALVLDLEYALDKKVEQDLWNIGFKNHVSILQELARDKKNIRRSECQALLTSCLEAASGFYLTLLHELCNTFDVDLPFRRRGNAFGQSNSPTELNLPQSSSCLYICQYCLVHLGDIARYRNQRKQAENFYKQAILVSPTSGHPYNQLALLEASQGNKLSTVFYYVRGITVKNPFPAATTNLLSTLNSTVDKESPLEKVQTKITVNEFIQIFLCTHAFLHTATDLDQAEIGVRTLNAAMTALVATQSFTAEKLIKMTAINLYALKHVISNSTSELTEDEKSVRHHILDLLAGSLSALLIPVHTLKNDESILDYYALSAVKLLTYWIKNDPDVLKESVFANRLQIWPSLCKLLNNVEPYLKDFDFDKYATCPLSEDRALQGFRPLMKSFREMDFNKPEICDEKVEKLIRTQRLVEFGLFLTQLDVNHSKLVTTAQANDNITFEPGCIQPDPTNDLLEEMKSFNVSDASATSILKNNERRGGILKPQGSLEKAREERELLSSGELSLMSDLSNASSTSSIASKKEPAKGKRSKQNVAIQSIFKKIEESKQVKFNVDVNVEKEIFDGKPKTSSSTSQFNPSLRTQSFNQNHPAFPVPPNQQDYLHTLRNITKQPNSIIFPPNTEIPPPNLQNVPPPSMVTFPNNMQNPQSMFNNNINNPTSNFGSSAPMPSNSFNPTVHSRPLPQFQNVPFSQGNHLFNVKMEESSPAQNAPWWPAGNSSSRNYQRPEPYQMNIPYGNNMPYMPPQTEFNKPQANQAGGDMFNSPWSSFQRTNFMDGSNVNYDNSHAVSMRQAMLQESSNMQPMATRTTNTNDNFIKKTQNSPGYSLFNTNSWSPNLMGQLRNSKSQDSPVNPLQQQSLFTGQGPQSLAQLLEQQQAQKHDS